MRPYQVKTGILTRANDAKVNTEKSMEKEQIDLAWASLQIGETGLYNENITS